MSQAFSSWYFSWTSGDPHRSGFKLHTAVLSYYVPSIAVFCSESIECFPGTASKFFFKLLVTIPVAPINIGIIVHFRFHIRCISIHKLLYFNFFSASFCTTFLSAGIRQILASDMIVQYYYYYYYYYYYCPVISFLLFSNALHQCSFIRIKDHFHKRIK